MSMESEDFVRIIVCKYINTFSFKIIAIGNGTKTTFLVPSNLVFKLWLSCYMNLTWLTLYTNVFARVTDVLQLFFSFPRWRYSYTVVISISKIIVYIISWTYSKAILHKAIFYSNLQCNFWQYMYRSHVMQIVEIFFGVIWEKKHARVSFSKAIKNRTSL
jgi:hypothetical protein